MHVPIYTSDQYPKRAKRMQDFMQKMSNRLAFGCFRHQAGKDEFGHPSQDYLKRLKETIRKYEKTGNLELLVDAGNYCALEFYNSLHPQQHFSSSDSNGKSTLNQDRI
jgi:uncharacterized Fe-S cluster-containing MiaB family protein